tara:strand:- start:3037 stop:3828 length:792 start_codon:yes stop_codon:yes gene_type:complete
MEEDKTQKYIDDHLIVISLKRTPHRLESFFKRNANALEDWNVHVLDGVDGTQHWELFKKSRLISSNVLNGWSPGAIGSALSHMLSWRLCQQLGKPILIAEDDVILAKELKHKLEILLKRKNHHHPFLLLGWNLDSVLQAELEPGLGLISLFEPAYPKEKQLTQLVNCKSERKACKLKRCFGLPAYRITPETAKNLLNQVNPLSSEPIAMGRGIPAHFSETLDGVLNNRYEKIKAEIVFPPLALALNIQNESLTRKSKPKNFEG